MTLRHKTAFRSNARKILLWMLAAWLALAACGGTTPQPPVLPATPTQTAATPVPPTPAPSATPTETPLQAILLVPDGADPVLAGVLLPVVQEQASQAGLLFEERAALSPEDVRQGVQIVIALPPVENLAALAASAPQVLFIGVDIPGLEPAANLSAIVLAGRSSGRLAFAAGYLGGSIAEDWRIGLLTAQGAPDSTPARIAYANGLAFLCGLCRQVYPPFPIPGYPIVVELVDPADPSAWESALAELSTWQVQVVYVTRQAASPELYQAIGQAGFQVIGLGPAPSGLGGQWVASLDSQDPEPVLLEAWEALAAGSEGQSYRLDISLSQVNPDLLSPGRQRWVEEILADLAAGFIDTGAEPVPTSQP